MARLKQTKANFEEPDQLTPTNEWDYLRPHYRRMIDNLNVRTLLPHLIDKGLLTLGEQEQLESMLSHDQNVYLLRILQRKGNGWFRLFLECLKEEKEHLGHKDLAICLGLSSQEPIEV